MGDLTDDPDNFWRFLFAVGYLTSEGSTDLLQLKIPNLEVKNILVEVVKRSLKKTLEEQSLEGLLSAFLSKKAAKAAYELTRIQHEVVSYHDYKEAFYHAFVAGLFAERSGIRAESNVESGLGRADLIVYMQKAQTALVIECKAASDASELKALARLALDQCRRQEYAKKPLDLEYQVILAGLAFYKSDMSM